MCLNHTQQLLNNAVAFINVLQRLSLTQVDGEKRDGCSASSPATGRATEAAMVKSWCFLHMAPINE